MELLEKVTLIAVGALVALITNGLNDRRKAKQKRAEDLIKAYAEWGAAVLKSIRLKRSINRIVAAFEEGNVDMTSWPDDLLTVKEQQIEVASAAYSSDLAQLILVQLDPPAINAVNQVNALIWKEELDKAEKAAVGMIASRARQLGKLPPIEVPEAD